MASRLDKDTAVFIVRIWQEPREIERAAPEWRGVVEHVPSGERRYFTDLSEITILIIPYLNGQKIKLDWCARWRQWLRRWKQALLI